MDNFLDKQVILDDYERFAEGITKRYEVKAIPFVEKETEEIVKVGYLLFHKKGKYKFYMPYKKHPITNELAQNAKYWTVYNGNLFITGSSLSTIGEVMEYLNIKEKS